MNRAVVCFTCRSPACVVACIKIWVILCEWNTGTVKTSTFYSNKWWIKLPVSSQRTEQKCLCVWLHPLRVHFSAFKREKQRALWEYPLTNLKSKLNSEHGWLDDSCQCDKRYYQVGFKLLCWRQPGGVQEGFKDKVWGAVGDVEWLSLKHISCFSQVFM